MLRRVLRLPLLCNRRLEIPDLLPDAIESLLILANLPDDVVSIPRIEPVDERGKFLDVAIGFLQSRHRRGRELALPEVRSLGRVRIFGMLGFAPQLLAQQVQEELLEGLGAQSVRIVRGSLVDQAIVLEEVGDTEKRLVFDAVRQERLEQQ
ncbi:hypothetical protein VTK73DRAFT_6772 [Phialemonium thermophilum]|uniref:Uncharacterized protein n=1 Tax=Phialemonium thermophilum TaxID=223376 RepID=A0ABR3WI67_9PEZI